MPVRDVGRAYGHRGMLLLAAAVQARQWIQDVYSVVLSIFLGCMHALRTTDDTKRGFGWRSGSKGLGIQGPRLVQRVQSASQRRPARTRRSLAPPSVYTEQGKVYAFRPISNCTATMSVTGSRLWGWIPAYVFQRAYVRVHRGVSA